MSRKLFFAAWGTLGEVLPLLRLAAHCRTLGHQAMLAANPAHAPRAAALGVPFTPIGPRLDRPPGASPTISLSHRDNAESMIGQWLDPYLPQQVRECAAAMKALGGCDAVIASWIVPGALIAAERDGVPLLFCSLYPLALVQKADFPVLPNHRRASRRAKASLDFAGRFHLAAARKFARLAPGYAQIRGDLNLSPYEGTIFEGPPGATRLALFSRHILTTPETNAPTQILGFVPDGRSDRLPDAVAAFLKSGAAPVLISFGSAVSLTARTLMEACARAGAASGNRVIVISAAFEKPTMAAPNVLLIPGCALQRLMLHCACVVTHGGIGTIGDALAAGCPLLCIPHFGDQFDNADRMTRLGIGRTLLVEQASERAVANDLAKLTRDSRYRDAMAPWPGRIGAENPLDAFASIVAS